MLYSTITLLALKKLWIPSLMSHLPLANKEALTVRDPIPLRAVTLPRALAGGCVALFAWMQADFLPSTRIASCFLTVWGRAIHSVHWKGRTRSRAGKWVRRPHSGGVDAWGSYKFNTIAWKNRSKMILVGVMSGQCFFPGRSYFLYPTEML